jgi:hypothetical protein
MVCKSPLAYFVFQIVNNFGSACVQQSADEEPIYIEGGIPQNTFAYNAS